MIIADYHLGSTEVLNFLKNGVIESYCPMFLKLSGPEPNFPESGDGSLKTIMGIYEYQGILNNRSVEDNFRLCLNLI